MMSDMESFRKAVESGDLEAAVAALAPDVVFNSPVVFRPYRGRDEVGRLLRAVAPALEAFRYTDELRSGAQTALVFSARVGEGQLQGIDLLGLDAHGRVAQLTVFVRPLSAATALAEAMAK